MPTPSFGKSGRGRSLLRLSHFMDPVQIRTRILRRRSGRSGETAHQFSSDEAPIAGRKNGIAQHSAQERLRAKTKST
jgi:hypothetical protein